MNPNVGGLDRTARLVVGPLALLAGLGALVDVLPAGSLVGAVLVVGGAILLVTGATRRCPLNSLLGVDTCPRS
jgi:uncharacterized membrane protein HdeD (DUF308 family)